VIHVVQRIQGSFDAQGLMKTLGASLLKVDDGVVQIALPFSAALSQQHGYMHAGAITSVVDSACGYAALTKAPTAAEVVTAEFKVNFMRPAIGRRFVAIGRVQSAGRMLAVVTGEVRAYADDTTDVAGAIDAPHKQIALMQATMVYVGA
jgi:uncharacterized protein (TIGR00369 family)